MKILVTGAGGFIGHHLANKLIELGHEVTAIDNFYYSQGNLLDRRVNLINGDIRNLELLISICRDQEIIFHLAALANIRESVANPDYCFSTNVLGTFNLLQAIKGSRVKKIIFTSSREVYGNAESFPVNEGHLLRPVNLYGVTKVCGEQIVDTLSKSFGVSRRIVRLANVYGKEDSVPGRVIPSFIRAAKEEGEITIYGGEQILDFVWIEDVIQVLLESLNDKSEKTINVGSGKGVSIKELASKIVHLFNNKTKINILDPPAQEVSKFIADITLMGFTPLDIDEGLRRIISK